jgi:uncharacterized protein YndB with AHSA1/START domain
VDDVFRALADPTRRFLLDQLREHNGQTLGALTERVQMRRQSVTQHLGVLEAANLVTVVRQGREKLHYLNPVPLHELQQRWMQPFEPPRLRALAAIKRHAEEGTMADRPTFVYTIYIKSTAERVWQALTDAELTAAYWGHSNVSTWEPGATWEHRRTDGSGVADVVGVVEVSEPPHRLVSTWALPDADPDRVPSRVTFTVEEHDDLVRLTVLHEELPDDRERATAAHGWAAVMSNLKSLLETGDPLPQPPWAMPVE